jgi:hypothetical protein
MFLSSKNLNYPGSFLFKIKATQLQPHQRAHVFTRDLVTVTHKLQRVRCAKFKLRTIYLYRLCYTPLYNKMYLLIWRPRRRQT